MAVEDVLAAKAVELDQQFGLATAVEAHGVLPALVVGADVSVATADRENLKLNEVKVDRVLEIEAVYSLQFDRSELWGGADADGIEQLAVNGPEGHSVHLRSTSGEAELVSATLLVAERQSPVERSGTT